GIKDLALDSSDNLYVTTLSDLKKYEAVSEYNSWISLKTSNLMSNAIDFRGVLVNGMQIAVATRTEFGYSDDGGSNWTFYKGSALALDGTPVTDVSGIDGALAAVANSKAFVSNNG